MIAHMTPEDAPASRFLGLRVEKMANSGNSRGAETSVPPPPPPHTPGAARAPFTPALDGEAISRVGLTLL